MSTPGSTSQQKNREQSLGHGQALKKPFGEEEVEGTAVERSLMPCLGCYGLCPYCLTLSYF